MQNETTYSGILGEWQRLLSAMEANTGEIPHLEASRVMFADRLSQAQTVIQRQAALAAEKQQSSQDLRSLIVDGQRLATMLRKGLKQFYGIRSEKLTEFGLPPFRGRSGRKQPSPPPPPPPEATAPTTE
jgi:hypothetical protein